jgi:hypothetical protein
MDGYDKIISLLEKPYIKNLITMGIDKEHYDEIFKRIFKEPIIVGDKRIYTITPLGKCIYQENSNGEWYIKVYNKNDITYYENSSGNWFKREYDENRKVKNVEYGSL